MGRWLRKSNGGNKNVMWLLRAAVTLIEQANPQCQTVEFINKDVQEGSDATIIPP
jgi:hypothetical protein